MTSPEVTCVVDAHAQIGEGAVWDDAEQVLYWVDIPAGEVHRFDPATGEDRAWTVGEAVGSLAVRSPAGLVLATRTGFWLYDPGTGERIGVADPEPDRPDSRFNDGATDPAGRFWAGTMKDRGARAPVSALYRLDPDLTVHPGFGGLYVSNGLAFSPDGRTMYFSDSHPDVRTIWGCDYDLDDGVATNRRAFFDTRSVAGLPDGGTVDSEGCYWMAGIGGWQVVRLTPDGAVDRVVEMPVERPSKPMFGGLDLDVLFVTSLSEGVSAGSEEQQPQAGGLFAVTGLGVTGLPQKRFAG